MQTAFNAAMAMVHKMYN